MTHDEMAYQIDELRYAIYSLLEFQELIRIVKEISDESVGKKFDRISLLLTVHESYFECSHNSIKNSIDKLHNHFFNDEA